ncbi:MAG: DNA starvation/stationary phase protection protein [Zymomonas mobilis subsp. pomaceae]|uniref:Ferritin Dps family protein n=1 Tax=Zymomonas mobilis subsp. pomaceae (strain ATCC 29192 / DSM 22645 / JCM 10191 / CCUG 17912 / NBRC 13757 / NCIMB 11200 / NRRL B-4491 / Barker I) TaxID=579138 RepID=F8ESP8_ZYMMT|nr:DNA starvation/stationary phase protection protein [Zymomonas mobilis]AEI37823.1 Ferritin Dps family protein [Zymomonas mobilis subsp. pomaceae ATCC 29192]MDX5949190.1 DNA starvation/stationary phase protection protein [Zymomonas mobilis subsp. pomaceae]GEB89582.1 DNA starvation/stationary phase protection protein [Zymomonas mobilis subsp. pomaceae]
MSVIDIKTPSDLDSNKVGSVADALNHVLADTFALYLKTKNFHWHVSGPHFRDYHLLFEDQASEIFSITDEVAERVRKIGKATLHSIGEIFQLQSIEDNDKEFVKPEEMLKELASDNRKLVTSLREAKILADKAGDNASSAMIDNWTDQAERRAWFLFETGRAA